VEDINRDVTAVAADIQRLLQEVEQHKEKRQALIDRAAAGQGKASPTMPSGVEWLGRVPTHWKVKKLGWLLRERPSYGVLKPDRYDGIDAVPLIRINDIDQFGTISNDCLSISPEQDREYVRTKLNAGDVLVSVVGTLGRCALVGHAHQGANVSRALARLQVGQMLTPAWLMLVLSSNYFTTWVDAITRGAAQRVLNMGDLASFRLPLPPISEQEQLTNEIRHQLGPIDQVSDLAKTTMLLLEEHSTQLIMSGISGKILVPEGSSSVPREAAQ
jgi:type I restriction enzyme S subunit